MFSKRTSWSRTPSGLSLLIDEAHAAGRDLIDLTESNPTRCALGDRREEIALLGDPRAVRYQPEPFGLPQTRSAVVDYYARRGRTLTAGQLVLTASTSEAYGWLFKLLCDPGDAVLMPQPSYPLLPYLAGLDAVDLVDYPLMRDEGWRVDVAAVRRALDDNPRARAIVLVQPANPTGSMVRADDASELTEMARASGVALIVDEVFFDYRLVDAGCSFAGDERALCFALSGLSKVALLPQAKLGWIAVSGPGASEALARLEMIADSYLSVSTAVQLATPAILARADALQATLRERLAHNLAAIDDAIGALGASCPLRRLPCAGGWYALVEVPRTRSEEHWVARLLEREGIIVHPGYFFDMDEGAVMVISLLLEPQRFASAIKRATRLWAAG